MVTWQKAGRCTFQDPVWDASYAAVPFFDTDAATGQQGRVFFTPRNSQGRGQIYAGQLHLQSNRVVEVSDAPLLSFGELGTFDHRGATMGWLVHHGSTQYLYYSGWCGGTDVPFYLQIGLATSTDDGRTFQRHSQAPILERTAADPLGCAAPCVMQEDGQWRMWYTALVRWEQHASGVRHFYHIRHATSDDGIHWQRSGHVCIDFAGPEEYALARPCVVRHDGTFRMWFCCRGGAYRLGYAESADGLLWHRNDAAAGLTVSSSGWDSEMLCYPHVFRRDAAWHMLYNGNGYGKSGMGYAVAQP